MKRLFAILLLSTTAILFAQERTTPHKFALVIGNSTYTNLSKLANPVNDATDVANVLGSLGFAVDIIKNGSLEEMEKAVLRLRENLRESEKAYGFFFFAGHGVQSGGENFLIPVDANIPSDAFLRNKSLSVQAVLDELNEAGNGLNVVVLDACRDNPFGWSRAVSSRGLATITRQPADSIIVYATSAGQIASDGTGRNGMFTSQLLPNLATPGLDVNEIFKRTGADVAAASNRQQIPAIYNQFFGTAFLGVPGEVVERPAASPFKPVASQADKSSQLNTKFWSIGASIGTSFDDPLVIGTFRGTLAPFKYSFFNTGLELGFASKVANVTSYYTLRPFLHYVFFYPFSEIGGVFAGTGLSYERPEYYIDDLLISDPSFYLDFVTGLMFFNWLELTYTARTNFYCFNGKLAIGAVYRFK